MTGVRDLVGMIERDAAFKRLPSGNYLAHVFCHDKAGVLGEVEVGYCAPDGVTITVFRTSPVIALPPDKAFREKGKVPALSLDGVTVGLAEAREKALALAATERPQHPIAQVVYLLRQEGGPTWFVTVITTTMHLLEIRIDAVTGEASLSAARSLLDFGTPLRRE